MVEGDRLVLVEPRRSEAKEEIKRYFDEERDECLGDLATGLILDFFLDKIAPMVYDQALDDSLGWVARRLQDLESDFRGLYLGTRRHHGE